MTFVVAFLVGVFVGSMLTVLAYAGGYALAIWREQRRAS
jgi:hypothetical protein